MSEVLDLFDPLIQSSLKTKHDDSGNLYSIIHEDTFIFHFLYYCIDKNINKAGTSSDGDKSDQLKKETKKKMGNQ